MPVRAHINGGKKKKEKYFHLRFDFIKNACLGPIGKRLISFSNTYEIGITQHIIQRPAM